MVITAVNFLSQLGEKNTVNFASFSIYIHGCSTRNFLQKSQIFLMNIGIDFGTYSSSLTCASPSGYINSFYIENISLSTLLKNSEKYLKELITPFQEKLNSELKNHSSSNPNTSFTKAFPASWLGNHGEMNWLWTKDLLESCLDIQASKITSDAAALLAFHRSIKKENHETNNYLVIDVGDGFIDVELFEAKGNNIRTIFSNNQISCEEPIMGNDFVTAFLRQAKQNQIGEIRSFFESNSFKKNWGKYIDAQFASSLKIRDKNLPTVEISHGKFRDMYQRLELSFWKYLDAISIGNMIDLNDPNFHIILGGGFCNNPLVETIITQFFEKFHGVEYPQMFIAKSSHSVSHGAAIIGRGDVAIDHNYPHKIDLLIYARKFGESELKYIIDFHTIIHKETTFCPYFPYWPLTKNILVFDQYNPIELILYKSDGKEKIQFQFTSNTDRIYSYPLPLEMGYYFDIYQEIHLIAKDHQGNYIPMTRKK